IEMLFADPGMTKAQSVQIVKNMLDKADMAIRHKLMDIVPDIVKWNESLDHTNSPRERWGHLFVDEEYIDIYGKKQKVKTTRIIQETTSDYLEVVMKYQFQDNYYNKEIAKLKNKTTPLT